MGLMSCENDQPVSICFSNASIFVCSIAYCWPPSFKRKSTGVQHGLSRADRYLCASCQSAVRELLQRRRTLSPRYLSPVLLLMSHSTLPLPNRPRHQDGRSSARTSNSVMSRSRIRTARIRTARFHWSLTFRMAEGISAGMVPGGHCHETVGGPTKVLREPPFPHRPRSFPDRRDRTGTRKRRR